MKIGQIKYYLKTVNDGRLHYMPFRLLIFAIPVEKATPMELKADNDFISQCQDYLETWGNTLAMYGKLGSGKRTLAAQLALRLA